MYWKTVDGSVLLIAEMGTYHLENCKRLLERSDIRISTLMDSYNKYSHTEVYFGLHEDDVQFSTTYDYTSSPEYKSILLELIRRG